MSDPPDPLLSRRMRAQLYLSDAAILFASAVLALYAGKGWAWGPFVVGPVIIAVAALCNTVMLRVGISVLKPTEEQFRRARSRQRNRSVIIVPGYVTFAIASGVISGSLESYWPDAALGAIFVVTAVAFPLALLPRLKRRADVMRASGSGAP